MGEETDVRADRVEVVAASPKSKTELTSSGEKLPLQAWLKLWTERGVNMRLAMVMAAKLYPTFPSLSHLSSLTSSFIENAGVYPALPANAEKKEKEKDKDTKRVVANALRSVKEVAKKKGKSASGQEDKTSAPSRKRRRDLDLDNPLIPDDPANLARKAAKYSANSFDFHEILDFEIIRERAVTTNRAPVMTAWAYIICEKMGFDRVEALSIASVFTSITSTQHALALGNVYNAEETKDALQELADLPGGGSVVKRQKGEVVVEEEQGDGNAQPWVGIMKRRTIAERRLRADTSGRRPVLQLANGSWRALSHGKPVEPDKAHSYITRNFGSETPYVIGALRLLARCFSIEELNEKGYGMYVSFRPEVRGWGDKGTLYCSNILDLCPLEEPDSKREREDVLEGLAEAEYDDDDIS